MQNDWQNIAIGELLKLQRGHDLPAQDRREGLVPIMGSSGLTGFHDTAKCDGPGVVVGRSGNSMGVVSYCDSDYWPLNTALYVTDFRGNDRRYIYYLLSQVDFNQFNSGSAQKSLNRNYVYPFKVWTTTNIHEQKTISAFLARLEKKIELNRQMNETLEAMAQALFKSWFVDFDPVIDNALTAGKEIPEPLQKRATARQALGDQRKPLPAEIQSLFPDSFVFTDEMGWVPKGWELGSLSDIATLKTKSIHPNKEPDKVWFHYSLPAYDDQEEPSHDLGESIKSGKYFVDQTSILVSKLNPGTPRVWMPCIDDEASSICSTEFMSFVPIVAGLRSYLYALARSDTFQSLMLSRVTGSTGSHQRVQPKGIAESEVLVPPEKLMLVFSAIADTWLSKKDNNKKQTLTLSKSRDSLLPKLLSGELRISDAEKQVAEAI